MDQQWKAGRMTEVKGDDDFPQAHIDGPGRRDDTWISRIVLYSEDVIAADTLRDQVIDLLNNSAREIKDLRANLSASSRHTNETALERNTLASELSIAKTEIANLRNGLSNAKEIILDQAAAIRVLAS